MHLATLEKPINWAGQSLLPQAYWMGDTHAAILLAENPNTVQLTHIPPFRALGLEDAKEITVVLSHGFGNMLWMNAIYAEIRKRYPALKIAHSCLARYSSPLLGFVDRVLPYPLLAPWAGDKIDYDGTWWLETVLEFPPIQKGEHPADRLAAVFGLEPLAKKAAYEMTDKERKAALHRWPRKAGTPRVCVEVDTDNLHTAYSPLGRVLAMLGAMGIEILIVGRPGKPQGEPPKGCYHAPGKNSSIRESIAMASHCDGILAADSAFLRVGAALDIPVVGIFGATEGKAILQGQIGEAVQGVGKCSPCNFVPSGGKVFPEKGPCAKTGQCEVAKAIDPRDVVSAVLRMVG